MSADFNSSSQNQVPKVGATRQCYVEEQAKPRDSFMVDAYKILKSLMKNLRRLVLHLGVDDIHSQQQANLSAIGNLLTEALSHISPEGDLQSLVQACSRKDLELFTSRFTGLAQIEQLRKAEKSKYVGRNMLGLRKFDDWIHTLEIGNIMHLNPLSTAELIWSASGKHQEFQKDPMLKKLVLLVVALFSIATEMRMMVTFGNKQAA